MKILKKDLKHGEVKILPESLDDIWYISQILDPGDILKGKTPRKIKATETAEGEKRMVFIALTVEKVEFSKTTNALRASGKIVDGPEDVPRGSYHTFAIEPDTAISIVKEKWFGFQLDRLQEAAESAKTKILICVFDREEAIFALMKRSGAEILGHIRGDVERKRIAEKAKGSFYEEIVRQLQQYDGRLKLDFIVLASPAFWKEELLKVLRDDNLKKKIVQATCSSVDENAINEVLKRDEVRSALRQERVSQEMVLVEKVLSEIAKKGAVVYGLKACEDAVLAGAVETLLVTDSLIQRTRQEGTFQRLESVMKGAEKQKGLVTVISTGHSGGKKLDGLGGIAGLLRYKLSYE